MEKGAGKLNTLKKLFALSRDAVIGVNKGAVVFANAPAERLFGRDPTGERVAVLLPELDEGALFEDCVTAVTINGAGHTVSCVAHEGVQILTVLREAAAPVNAGAALISRMRSEAYRLRFSIDRLLASRPDEDEYVRILYHSFYSLTHLIGQLSDAEALSRGDMPLRTVTLDLGTLARELTDSVAYFVRDRDVTIHFEAEKGPFIVSGDRERLEQLLLILLSNALLHARPGGIIRIGLESASRSHILCVDDDGEGMDETALSYAFSLREDASPASAAGGAGMGLYIAYALARQHGGTVLLRSAPGEGTRVRVTLPAHEGFVLHDAPREPARGPELILTELSGVLGAEAYDPKYRQ